MDAIVNVLKDEISEYYQRNSLSGAGCVTGARGRSVLSHKNALRGPWGYQGPRRVSIAPQTGEEARPCRLAGSVELQGEATEDRAAQAGFDAIGHISDVEVIRQVRTGDK